MIKKVDLFEEDFGIIDRLAVIPYPDKDNIDYFYRNQETENFSHRIYGKKDEDGHAPCKLCGEINWTTYAGEYQTYLYESDGNGKISYIGHFNNEDEMFEHEVIANMNPVRISAPESFNNVANDKQVFYFNEIYGDLKSVCPACNAKLYSNTLDLYSLDQIKNFANEMLYDDCDILIYNRDQKVYLAHIDMENQVLRIYKSSYIDK